MCVMHLLSHSVKSGLTSSGFTLTGLKGLARPLKYSAGLMKRVTSASLLLSLVTGTLVLVLVTVFTLSALDAYRRERLSEDVVSGVRLSRRVGEMREALRVEMGEIYSGLTDPLPVTPEHLGDLIRAHRRSMAELQAIETMLVDTHAPGVGAAIAQALARQRQRLDGQLFPVLVAALQKPAAARPANPARDTDAACITILDAVDGLDDVLSRDIGAAGPYLDQMMRISSIAWYVRQDAGHARHTLTTVIADRRPATAAEHVSLEKFDGRIEAAWEALQRISPNGATPSELSRAVATANVLYFRDHLARRAALLAHLSQPGGSSISPRQWRMMAEPALHSLMAVSQVALDMAERRAMENLARGRGDLLKALALMALSIGLSGAALAIVFLRVIRPLNAITRAMTSGKEEDIERALALRARTDEIGLFARALKVQRQGAAERQRLDTARRAAETASRIKSEFLANMSHELRTPLNAVIGFSEMMLHKTFGPLPERYEEYAGLINNAGNHLLSLVSDILDLAKIEAGRFVPDFQHFDLKVPAEASLALIRSRARERGITVAARLPDGALMVEADARAIKQILLNLLSNAVKFSRPGGTVLLALAARHDGVEIRVKDEGIGIPADVLARIGQPFEQACNNPMLAREGTGLGLALVKALVAEHGGQVNVTSQENVGTEIVVTLPVRQGARETRAA